MSRSQALVTIILPTLNSMRFLQERMESIFNQSFQDWELIVVDSYSDDGTFEYLSKLAEKDSRIHLFQAPKGLYQAWNFGISHAQGEYVYIATSDDSMTPDCLQKMVTALQNYPECDLCDSILKLIDAEGNEIIETSPNYVPHYWHIPFPRESIHLRQAPCDFFAHMGGKTIYTSVTQILIRTTLFQKTGLFPVDFGSSADYLWGIRAARHANIIFLPEKLATWRIHAAQATGACNVKKINKNFHLMSQMACLACSESPNPLAVKARKIMRLIHFKEILLPAKYGTESRLFQIKLVICAIFSHPFFSLEFFITMFYYRFISTISLKFLIIYTYDKMISRRVSCLTKDKIQIIHPLN